MSTPGGPRRQPTLVFVEFWQHECCGDLFAVGDEVTWPVAPDTGDGLARLLADDLGRRIRLRVERHDDDVRSLSGTVRSISSVFCEHERVEQHPDGPHHRPAAGSGVLQRIERTARSEHRDDLEWSGYVVELDPGGRSALAPVEAETVDVLDRTRRRRPPAVQPARVLLALSLLVVLTGCSGAQDADVPSAGATSPAPAGSASPPPPRARVLADWVSDADDVCRTGVRLYPSVGLGVRADVDTVAYGLVTLSGSLSGVALPDESTAQTRAADLAADVRAAARRWNDLARQAATTAVERSAAAQDAAGAVTALVAAGATTPQMFPLRCPAPLQKSGGGVHRLVPQRRHRQDGASPSTTEGLAGYAWPTTRHARGRGIRSTSTTRPQCSPRRTAARPSQQRGSPHRGAVLPGDPCGDDHADGHGTGAGSMAVTGEDRPPELAAHYPDPRTKPWPGFALAAAAGVRHLHEQLGMDLWLVTHLEGDELVVVAAAGPWEEMMAPGTRVPWSASFCSRMVDRIGPVCAPDVLDVPVYAPLVSGVFGRVRAYVGIALEGDDGQFFGTMSAVSGVRQPPSLTASMPVIQIVGQMLSTIVAREQVAQARSADAAAAYALAQRDQLTGLANRRGWVSAMEHEETRCSRYGSTASVLVLDLDGLKQVNDTGGHAAGDELIALCGEVLRVVCRPGDTVARTGGDEFAVLAVECDSTALQALEERLRMQLSAAGVTAATGGATRRTGEHLADTWRRADTAMYSDKRRRGRRSSTASVVDLTS